MSVIERKVEDLVIKATETKESHVAMQFAQAALNAAHAAQVLSIIKREEK